MSILITLPETCVKLDQLFFFNFLIKKKFYNLQVELAFILFFN